MYNEHTSLIILETSTLQKIISAHFSASNFFKIDDNMEEEFDKNPGKTMMVWVELVESYRFHLKVLSSEMDQAEIRLIR